MKTVHGTGSDVTREAVTMRASLSARAAPLQQVRTLPRRRVLRAPGQTLISPHILSGGGGLVL